MRSSCNSDVKCQNYCIANLSAEVKVDANARDGYGHDNVPYAFLVLNNHRLAWNSKLVRPTRWSWKEGHHLFAHRHRQRFIHICERGGRAMKGEAPVRVNEIKV